MNCECGIPAFFYTTIKQDKIKYEVFKCGSLTSESKKGKCSLNAERPIKPVTFSEFPVNKNVEEYAVKDVKDAKSEIIENLENFIHLLEISKNNYGMSRDNYISNINFNLRRLGFPLFFNKKESIISLKFRIYDVIIKTATKKTEYPVVIIEIPENLKTINKKKICRIKHISKKSTPTKYLPKLNVNEEEILEKIKKMDIKMDSDSESESEHEDNTFDVDNYDSEDNEPFDDGGALSD
jgi:hypothetical protein